MACYFCHIDTQPAINRPLKDVDLATSASTIGLAVLKASKIAFNFMKARCMIYANYWPIIA